MQETCFSVLASCSFYLVIFMLIVHSSDFFKNNKKTRKSLLGVRPLDMAPVEQLGDDSWLVVCAALCHMALVFAIKHLYNFFLILYYIYPFLFLYFSLTWYR